MSRRVDPITEVVAYGPEAHKARRLVAARDRALAAVRAEPGVEQAELAEALAHYANLTEGTALRLIRAMVKAGLLGRSYCLSGRPRRRRALLFPGRSSPVADMRRRAG